MLPFSIADLLIELYVQIELPACWHGPHGLNLSHLIFRLRHSIQDRAGRRRRLRGGSIVTSADSILGGRSTHDRIEENLQPSEAGDGARQ